MYTMLLVAHTLLIFFLVGIILVQRSDSDGLSGLSGGGGNVLSGRTAGNVLTRTTFILGGLFIITSITLAIMTGRMAGHSIVNNAPAHDTSVPAASMPETQPTLAPNVPKPE